MKNREMMHLSIRFDKELHDKFQYISEYEGRTMSRQIVYLISRFVRNFEQKHGPIDLSDIQKK